MFLRTSLADGAALNIILGHETGKRLRNTCFRGRNKRLAGNFFLWSHPEEPFSNFIVRGAFLESVSRLANSDQTGQQISSVTARCSEPVGWESTAPLSDYGDNVLEEFAPNRKSRALRVKPECKFMPAPLTRRVTLVYTLHAEEGRGWVAIIRTLYPGVNIGELKGDVTRRERRVFFDWNHPGCNP